MGLVGWWWRRRALIKELKRKANSLICSRPVCHPYRLPATHYPPFSHTSLLLVQADRWKQKKLWSPMRETLERGFTNATVAMTR